MSKREVIKSIFGSSWFRVDESDYLKLSRDNVQDVADLVLQHGRKLLNKRQCADLSSKLVKVIDSIQELVLNKLTKSTGNPFKPALENFYRISVKAKLLVVCCSDKNWWKSAVFQVQNEEAFRDILLEVGFCYNVIYEQAKVIFCYNVICEQPNSTTESNFFQTRDLNQSFLPASKIEVRKDKKELQTRLEDLEQDPSIYARCLARYLLGRLKVKISPGGSDSIADVILWDKMTEPEHTWEVQGSIGSGAGATGGVKKIKWLGIPCAMKEFEQVQDTIFQNEAAILAQLHHPNIVKFVCCSIDVKQGTCFLGMELMEMSLDKTIENQSKSGGPFPNHVALDIILQIARGMCYLHHHGIAHRDLKPQNVVVNKLVGSYYSVKLVDFGMSKTKVAVSKSNTISKLGVGTTIYRAPEVSPKLSAQGGKLKACWFKADTYSYALTCAHILSVTEPFKGLPKVTLNEELLKGRRPELPPTTPPALVALLRECWSFEAQSRPSFLEICTTLEEIRQDVLGIVPALPHNFQPTRHDFLSYSHIEKKYSEFRNRISTRFLNQKEQLRSQHNFSDLSENGDSSHRSSSQGTSRWSRETSFGVHGSESREDNTEIITFLGLEGPEGLGIEKSDWAAQQELHRRPSYYPAIRPCKAFPDPGEVLIKGNLHVDHELSSSEDDRNSDEDVPLETRHQVQVGFKLIDTSSTEGAVCSNVEKFPILENDSKTNNDVELETKPWMQAGFQSNIETSSTERATCLIGGKSVSVERWSFDDGESWSKGTHIRVQGRSIRSQESTISSNDGHKSCSWKEQSRSGSGVMAFRWQPNSFVVDEDEEDTNKGIDALAVLTISPKSLQPASDALTEENIEPNFLTELTHVLITKKPSWNSWSKGAILGSGSFGTVYMGVGSNGMHFAVKEVSLSDPGKGAKEATLQLEQEIDLLSCIQHPNIVQYLGTQREEDKKLYIFLELFGKGTLSSLYQRQEHLSTNETRGYTKQILCGLKYLHDRNIIHRDIKCSNILVDANGVVKLAGFGVAKQMDKLDMLQSCKGSAYWMAPEVIDPKQSYNHAADIWSVGCTVLEMAAGEPPFGELEWHKALWKVGHGEAPPIPEDCPADLRDFISKCLDVNVANRPDCDALLSHPFITGTPILDTGPVLKLVTDPGLSSIAEETNFFNSVTSTSTNNGEPHTSTTGHTRSHPAKSVRTRRGSSSLTSPERNPTSREHAQTCTPIESKNPSPS